MEARKMKGKSWRHAVLIVSIALLLIALPLLGACAEKEVTPTPIPKPTPKQSTMTILGTVKEMANEYETGASLSNVNVELYTHEEPELPQLPPIGDKVASTRTDEQGSYKFEIGLETLPQNCNELVVFVDRGYMGWMTVSVSPSPTQVDLAKGSIPLP